MKDIEQLVELGKEIEGCPYYSTRYALPLAQVQYIQYAHIMYLLYS